MKPSFRAALAALALVAATTGIGQAAPAGPPVGPASRPAAAEEFPLPPGFAGGYREIDGVRMHYVTGGRGPLVLLVHGFGQTWYEWHQLMPLLARDHTVVAVDLPGLGLSGAPRSYAGQDVAETIHRLARTLGTDTKFDLVAHDIGIWNTYPMLASHQADIGRVVYMEAPIPDEGLYSYPAFTPEGESLVWHFSLFSAGNHLAETLITGKERFFLDHFIKEHATNKAVFTPQLLDLYAKSYAKPGSLTAAFGYYRALNETARRNVPLARTKLSLPILAIGGGGHGGFAAAEADQIRKYATDVRGLVLPGCGHWLPEECAAPLNEAVVGFLAERR